MRSMSQRQVESTSGTYMKLYKTKRLLKATVNRLTYRQLSSCVPDDNVHVDLPYFSQPLLRAQLAGGLRLQCAECIIHGFPYLF